MTVLTILGALLLLVGLVYTAGTAISRGRMSDPRTLPKDRVDRTLEPRRRDLAFLGIGRNWPGLLMMVLGGLMLLVPVL